MGWMVARGGIRSRCPKMSVNISILSRRYWSRLKNVGMMTDFVRSDGSYGKSSWKSQKYCTCLFYGPNTRDESSFELETMATMILFFTIPHVDIWILILVRFTNLATGLELELALRPGPVHTCRIWRVCEIFTDSGRRRRSNANYAYKWGGSSTAWPSVEEV